MPLIHGTQTSAAASSSSSHSRTSSQLRAKPDFARPALQIQGTFVRFIVRRPGRRSCGSALWSCAVVARNQMWQQGWPLRCAGHKLCKAKRPQRTIMAAAMSLAMPEPIKHLIDVVANAAEGYPARAELACRAISSGSGRHDGYSLRNSKETGE